MRATIARVLILALFAAPAAARADDGAAVKELLDRAVKAQGGADKAALLRDLTLKGKAQANEGGMSAELAFDMSIREFDRVRLDLTMSVAGIVKKVTMVIVDDKGWARDPDNNKLEEAPKEVLPMMKTVLLALRGPSTPAALAGRKDLILGHGGEAKVDDAPCEVLRIARKDQPDVMVYFDKKTGLPLKSETQIKKPNGGEEQTLVLLFSDFKEFDGVKHFTKAKVTSDGKDLFEMELTDLKPGVKLEANTFDKP